MYLERCLTEMRARESWFYVCRALVSRPLMCLTIVLKDTLKMNRARCMEDRESISLVIYSRTLISLHNKKQPKMDGLLYKIWSNVFLSLFGSVMQQQHHAFLSTHTHVLFYRTAIYTVCTWRKQSRRRETELKNNMS